MTDETVEDYDVEEKYTDPDTGQIIIYDTDGNQHIESEEE